MRVPPFVRRTVALALLVSAALGMLAALGVRHRHEHGDVPHSHEGGHHSHHHHGDSTHTHTHADDHNHHHEHTSDRESGAAATMSASPTSHVHISLFGYLLTLPDLFAADDAPNESAAERPGRRQTGSNVNGVSLSPPSIPAQIVTLLFDVVCLPCGRSPQLPDPARNLSPADFVASDLGIPAAAPLLPPPRCV